MQLVIRPACMLGKVISLSIIDTMHIELRRLSHNVT
jgi:hypothetical protein